MFDVGLLV